MSTPSSQNGTSVTIEVRLRTMRTLWFAMLMSIVMWYVFTLFAHRPADAAPNKTLFLVLVSAALLTTVISFVVKSSLLNKAVDQQKPLLVQQAYVVAYAITEVGGLLAILDFFLTGDRYYYVMLIIAACGILLHAPKREHLVNASFQKAKTSDLWQPQT